jgi:hypothetical protein
MGLNSCPIAERCDLRARAIFICISGSTTPKENLLNRINQLKLSASWFANSTAQSDFF